MNAVGHQLSEKQLPEPLTRREQEILDLLAEGLTSGEIAERLTLAVSSVRWYLQQIYGKLSVNNKREAVTRASRLGLLHTKPAGFSPLPAAPDQSEASLPLAKPRQPLHNLPSELTSFIGREQEIAGLRERLAEGTQRLVTLTGAGGTGKTRLALQVARAALDLFPDGVWLVELAPLSDPRLVVTALGKCLGVHEVQNTPYQETLARYLGKKRLLLILDNCEHLLQECARLVDFLLRRCPTLALLATSREILNLAGETAYRVPSLSLPDVAQPDSASLTKYEAVQLFCQRACQVVPDFRLDESSAAAVATICRRLDGMPLAIELAAARMRLLTAPQIAARLDDVFRLLTGGSRNVLPRQQTLKATIDWSYALLSLQERAMLQRLSVFAGNWDLEAAEAVCAGEGIEAGEVLDLLGGLVDKSLAQAYPVESEQGQPVERYRMLETVRQYARDRLLEAGGSESVRDRHLSYYLKLGELAGEEITGSKQLAWVNRLEGELENLRLALNWALAGRIEDGLRLATALMWFWHYRVRHVEGTEWLQRFLDAAGVSADALVAAAERIRQSPAMETENIAQLLNWIWTIGSFAHLAIYSEKPPPTDQVLQLLEEAIALSRLLGEPASRELAWSLIVKGYISLSIDPEQSKCEFQESLEICRRNGYRFLEALCLSYSGWNMSVYDIQKAADHWKVTLSICESLGETELTAAARAILAMWLYPTGDYDRVRQLLQQSITFSKRVGNRVAWYKYVIYQYALLPEPANARQADEALAYMVEHELIPQTDDHLYFAETEWSLGNYRKAEAIISHVLLSDQISLNPSFEDCESISHMLLGRCAFSQGDLARAREQYLEMTPSWGKAQSLNLKLPIGALGAMAALLAAMGRMVPSAVLFGAMDELYQISLHWPVQRGIDEHNAALAAARQALGEAAFAQAWQVGKAMTLVEAFEYGQRAIRGEEIG